MIKKNCLILCSLLFMITLPTVASEKIQASFKHGIAAKSKQSQLLTEQKIKPVLEKNLTNTVDLDQNTLGLKWAENVIIQTENLIKNKKINEALILITPVESWLNDATEIHTSLYKTLRTINTAKLQADLEGDLALNFSMLRDKAQYQLGLIYIEEKQYQKAVKKLAEVVKSQPTSKLGLQSYELLQKIGFTYKVPLSKEESTTQEIKPF